MKYCVWYNERSKARLEAADEIRVRENEHWKIPEIMEQFPDKDIILLVETLRFEVIKNFEYKDKIIFELDTRVMNEYKKYAAAGLKFAYARPVATYTEVAALKKIGVEYIHIMSPLSFEMHYLEKIDVRFRMNPIAVYMGVIPEVSDIHGQWVRPEDVKYYEKGIYAFDFWEDNGVREATLLKIYKTNQKWEGNLNTLAPKVITPIKNQLFTKAGEVRANCGQKCERGDSCAICDRMIALPELATKAKEKREEFLNLVEKVSAQATTTEN